MPNFIAIFLTGLLTGGITCMAVQGALLTALVANQHFPSQSRTFNIIVAFISAKLVSHLIVGGILGWVGSLFGFSLFISSCVTVLLSLFMLGIGLGMLQIPFFRTIMVAPPFFVRRLLWKQSKRKDGIAPYVVGALTILIPCGTTQVMMAEAVRYANPLIGAMILGVFIFGTIPLFVVLGLSIGVLSEAYRTWFTKLVALFLIGSSFVNLYFISGTFGFDSAEMIRPIVCQVTRCEPFGGVITTTPTITIRRNGYDIDTPYIKAGKTITMTLKNSDGEGCIQFFVIPRLGVQVVVPVGSEKHIQFTAPTEPGNLLFSCSMGMYRGKFIVQ